MIKHATLDYIMDDPREAARLKAKVDPEAWVQKYMGGRIRSGMEVLSVGCGPGVILAAVCDLYPSVRGTGLDLSSDRIEEATRINRENPRTRFVCGDAQAMQFPQDSFDLVYCRMLLQYLPRKERAVAEMVRVCRRGGTVLLQDLDGQLVWHYPEDPALQNGLEKVVAALGSTGFDPFVGRKLFWLARKAGLENIDVQAESYHLIAGEIAPDKLEQWALKLDIAKPQLTRIFGSEHQAREYSRRFLEYLSRPDTLTYSTVFTVSGEKPLCN
jgi:ubiquinone/menaquinone biosynthesis C-methylase UbiE